MSRRRSLAGAALAAALGVAALAPGAGAADPGRWKETGRSTVPLEYYQGVASDPAPRLFFNGIYTGLYRADAKLNETGRTADVFPPAVHAREQYNHIGDIAWDAREGGRVLLPTECYYPQAAPDNEEDPNNTCRTGSIGVADDDTLTWKYYVKLDPAEIPKVMWVAVSPDGKLVWTQSRNDLLAYSMDDISPAHAHPANPPIKAVRRVKDARPSSGITGAAFYKGRLYMAGQDDPDAFRVWSIDLDTGGRRLEIEKPGIVGESEGIDFFTALGGKLHWLIQPYNTHGEPTYGFSNGTLLHFVPKGEKPTTPVARPARILLSVQPKQVQAGVRTKLVFHARAKIAGKVGPVDGATVRVGKRREAVTDREGRAEISFRDDRAGRWGATAIRRGLRRGSTSFRVRGPQPR
ncbi:MAG TPA: hypothetical protein VJT75_19090 [Thermoleophilaceae bacterium]|nr:hypothetical protein [Thermoleophilaceae bacterium]